MTESRDEAEERLDRAQREGTELRGWARWWQRRGREQLELILWAAWDPIGAGVPRDEYSAVATEVAKALRAGSSAREVADRMVVRAPVDASPDTTQDVAAKIVDWYAAEMRRADL